MSEATHTSMEDSVVVHRVPGTDLVPGCSVGMGPRGPIVVRRLTPDEVAAIRRHPSCLIRMHRAPAPDPSPRLRLLR